MNKRTLLIGIFALIALFFLGGCGSVSGQVIRGSGKVVQENRQVSGIKSVELDGIGDLVITQSDHEALTVEAEDNILAEMDIHMDGSKLVIGFKPTYTSVSINPTRPVRYLLTVKDLQKILLAGSGSIASSSLKTTSLDVGIGGSGNIDLRQVKADQVSAELTGSGTISMSGEAKTQAVTISGSGEFKGGDLKGSQAKVVISGSGSATVDAEDAVDALISGSGNVSYYANPKLTKNISGSGNIKSLGAN